MTFAALSQYAAFLVAVTLLVRPVGRYMARVFRGEKTLLDPLLCPLERLLYRLTGVRPAVEMRWQQYAQAFVIFSMTGTVLLYFILRVQRLLPWFFPAFMTTPMTPDLAMNTAVSFSTTTTWQAYAGETSLSYFSQVVGLMVQNFLAGAAGLAVGVAFVRGLAADRRETIGNFWVDLVRSILWVLLPLSLLGAVLLVWQGVPMNFHPYAQATGLEGMRQAIAQGPVAAFEIIKNLGTNGGGFFNVNGAHPYENPTPLSNFLEMLAIAVLPAAFTYTYGLMVGRPRHGWVLYRVMVFLFVVGLLVCGWAEQRGNPRIAHQLNAVGGAVPAAGNMEGKEVRFGIASSVLTTVTTSNGATGSYNSMVDSYTPIGGMVPLINLLLGEIVFGGLGTGLYSILMIALIALFLAGLMIGRTPAFLGKKIRAAESKMIMLYILAGSISILLFTALAVLTRAGRAGLVTNTGTHGLTEILFAYASANANNGMSFAGLNANSVFYNLTTAVTMMVGRFGLAIPALALAGLFAAQQPSPDSAGTLPGTSLSFAVLVTSTALIVSALSYFPALALGPLLEHLTMMR
ncbi:MAG: potassium-transporting ATPase subunit KdpA [Candidatus Korobacteraceae bacterium]